MLRAGMVALFGLCLAACAAPTGVVKLHVPEAPKRITIIDDRPEEEKSHRLMAKCNKGWWQGIRDDAFSGSRLDLLRARFEAAFDTEVKVIRVKRFRNCYLAARSSAAFAGVAGISYPAAVVLGGAASQADRGQQNLLETDIQLEVDGRVVTGSDLRPYTEGARLMYPYENPVFANVLSQSTEAAIETAIAAARKRH